MKILYFTDVHLKTKTPIRRTGDFEADILGKLAYLLITAQARKVDAIVCGGDLFDLPNPSYRLAVRVLDLIYSSGVKWFQVLGNHDIMGHNPDTYDMGVLAFYEHLPNFKILKEEHFETLSLKAIHYKHGVEEMDAEWRVSNRQTILVAHAMLVPTPVPFVHVLPSKVKTDARIVLAGHFHDPWANVVLKGTFRDDEKQFFSEGLAKLLTSKNEFKFEITNETLQKCTLFVNPGSVSRIAALAHNLRRTPRALLIDVGAEKTSLTSIPITVARSADEVFRVEEIEVEKRWENRVEQFLAAMENVKVEGMEAATLVINTAKVRGGVERVEDLPEDQKKVLSYALRVVERVEKSPIKREDE